MDNDHIHTPEDGRGKRKVYLNGKEVRYCVMADTKSGIVKHFDDPPKPDKYRKRAITRTKRGKVSVVFE